LDILNAVVLLANFLLLPAVSYGAQLALGALGITLIYGVLRIGDFAYGDRLAFGTMVVILATWQLQEMGVSLAPAPTALLALPFGFAATALVSLAGDRAIFRHLRAKNSSPIILSIASVGLMFVLNGLVRLIIGPDEQNFFDGARFLISVREFREMFGLREGLAFRTTQAVTIATAAVSVAATFWFLKHTRTGKSMRAHADNEELASLSGVRAGRVVAVTWILASLLAVIAGTLYGLDKSFRPFTYFQLLLPMFAAAILGGIGQPVGAIVGGFVVAFSEIGLTFAYKKFLCYLLPEGLRPDGLLQLLSTDYKFAISFLILVAVLVIRPTGIFRGRSS